MRETQYNQTNEVECTGVLNTCKNDCGCRKPSHTSWYKKKGQIIFSYEHVVELRYPGSRTIVYIPDSTWDLAPEGTAKPILLLDKNSKPVKEFIYGANDLLIEIRDIQKSRPKRTIAY